jgi:hypothetical protein
MQEFPANMDDANPDRFLTSDLCLQQKRNPLYAGFFLSLFFIRESTQKISGTRHQAWLPVMQTNQSESCLPREFS